MSRQISSKGRACVDFNVPLSFGALMSNLVPACGLLPLQGIGVRLVVSKALWS
jgi:hypothetical protein